MNIKALVAGGTLVGFVAGAISGYHYAKKRLNEHYDKAVQEEIAAAKKYYGLLYKREGYQTPQEAAQTLSAPQFSTDTETLERIVEGLRYVDPTKPQEKKTNIFEGKEDDSDVDYSKEEAQRSEDAPYIISVDEYMDGDAGFNQVTVTYFSGDKIIADPNDEPMDIVDEVIGDDNLERFGHRSRDPRALYVRNEKLRIDFEIVLSDGTYAEEVAGLAQG